MLEELGLTEDAERVYRFLTEQAVDGATAIGAASACALGAGRAEVAVRSLEALGLISQSPGEPIRYLTAPPDAAIEVLVLQHQRQLGIARVAGAQLSRAYQRALEAKRTNVIEILHGSDAIERRHRQLLLGTQHQLMATVKPPYVTRTTVANQLPTDAEMIRQGVRLRVIYAPESLGERDELEAAWKLVDLGEAARVSSRVPLKIVISDHATALLPLTTDGVATSAILVHQSGLLLALMALFDVLWDDALPLRAGVPGVAAGPRARPKSSDTHLLDLLTLGMTDAAIARQLGISARAVERRISQLKADLHVHTRFQLAYGAVVRGWLALPE
jgi:sugar-specific transcriptional regulator TrmB/DNA-binding CsgD family transcriptional regulator